MLAGSRILQAPRRACAGGCSHGTIKEFADRHKLKSVMRAATGLSLGAGMPLALRSRARCTVRVRVSEKEAEAVSHHVGRASGQAWA